MPSEETVIALAIGIPSLVVAVLALWIGYLTYKTSRQPGNQRTYSWMDSYDPAFSADFPQPSTSTHSYTPTPSRRYEDPPELFWSRSAAAMDHVGLARREVEGPSELFLGRSSFLPGQQWEQRPRHMNSCRYRTHPGLLLRSCSPRQFPVTARNSTYSATCQANWGTCHSTWGPGPDAHSGASVYPTKPMPA